MLTLIRNKLITPEHIARNPRRVKGGWVFTHPPKDLWRYNKHARNQAIREWTKYGAVALASIVGGCPIGGMGTLANDGPCTVPMPMAAIGAIGGTAIVNDAAAEYVGLVCHAPKTGSIRGFGGHISAATGSPTGDFQLETVDLTNGFPTGTLFGTNTSKTGVSIATGWQDSGDFTADASVARGDLLAAVIRYASGTSYSYNRPNTNWARFGFPYGVNHTGAAAKDLMSSIALRYSDGTYAYVPNCFPYSSTTFTEAWNSGSGNNHRGNVYLNPTKKRCVGGWITHGETADFTAIIASDGWDGTADNDGTSNLAVSVDADVDGFTVGTPWFFLSSTSLTFDAGTDYRVLCKPGAGTVTCYQLTISAAALMNVMQFGTLLISTQANDPTGAGSWTDSGVKRFDMGFWFDQFDDGAGGGAARGCII